MTGATVHLSKYKQGYNSAIFTDIEQYFGMVVADSHLTTSSELQQLTRGLCLKFCHVVLRVIPIPLSNATFTL